jgi:hypothetical protein
LLIGPINPGRQIFWKTTTGSRVGLRRVRPELLGFPGSSQPGDYENQWHWPRDTQLGEDAHRYAQRNGVQVLALLRTLALNLLRCHGFRSIRAGLMAVAHDISRMLGWVEISATRTG